jgi:hypothetical protein
MARSLTKRSSRAFGQRFVSAVNWLGIGLILISLLWIFAMVFGQAVVQLTKK